MSLYINSAKESRLAKVVRIRGRMTRGAMKLGFFTMPIHPLDKDWRKSLREDREAFILADKLGFIEGYVGEHATDRAENITSCAMFLSTLVDATKTMKLGTGTTRANSLGLPS